MHLHEDLSGFRRSFTWETRNIWFSAGRSGGHGEMATAVDFHRDVRRKSVIFDSRDIATSAGKRWRN